LALETVEEGFGEQVKEGLTAQQKWLPSKFLYDQLGSILFEAICVLPEYYLTRTERRILEENSRDIVSGLGRGGWLVELGAGSAVKTQILIQQVMQDHGSLVYCPIDISEEALRIAEANTRSRFPEVEFRGVQGDWFEVLGRLRDMGPKKKLIAFLGSSIGNMDHAEAVGFFSSLASKMNEGDQVLLGTDMVKDVEEMLPAYDDAAGVTAAFNRNVLVRLNRNLDGDFDPRAFSHEARWAPEESRVEMHLVARRDQTVRLGRIGLEVRLREGESIHTENSHKFTPEVVDDLAARAGLRVKRFWSDPRDRFRLNLLERGP
jgi:L-histidine Nalpha-methyltransferase